MKKIGLFLLFPVLALGVLRADTIPFRSGEVLAAELTRQSPEIGNFDETAFNLNFASKAYCLVTVRLTPGRSIGTADYFIEIFSRRYPCVAMRVDDGAFDAAVRELTDVASFQRIGLLFIIDGNVVGRDKTENLELKTGAPGQYQSFLLPFRNLGSQPFTPASRIPGQGAFAPAQ